MKVRVQAFQPFADTTIEVEGLTVIIGDSNAGKSALVRALAGALFNRPGANFVRVGESNASVAIENLPTSMKTMLAVEWVKGKTAHYFRVDGVLYKNVKTSAPDVLEAAGYRDVWVGDEAKGRGDSIRPQVAKQFDPLFLLDRPGSFLSDALTSASRLDVIQTAAGRAARDLKAARQEATKTEAELARHQKELAALEPAAALWLEMQRLRTELSTVVRQARHLEAARVLAVECRVLRAVSASTDYVISPVPESPVVRVEPAAERTRALATATHIWVRMVAHQAAGFSEPMPAPAGIDPLVRQWARCTSVRGVAVAMARLRAPNLPKLSAVPVFSADSMAAAATLIDRLQTSAVQRVQAVGALRTAEASLRSTAQDAEEADSAVHTVLADLDVCPTCERPMEAARG